MVTKAWVVSISSGGDIGRSFVFKELSLMVVPDHILNYSQASTRMDLFGGWAKLGGEKYMVPLHVCPFVQGI